MLFFALKSTVSVPPPFIFPKAPSKALKGFKKPPRKGGTQDLPGPSMKNAVFSIEIDGFGAPPFYAQAPPQPQIALKSFKASKSTRKRGGTQAPAPEGSREGSGTFVSRRTCDKRHARHARWARKSVTRGPVTRVTPAPGDPPRVTPAGPWEAPGKPFEALQGHGRLWKGSGRVLGGSGRGGAGLFRGGPGTTRPGGAPGQP